MIDATRPNDPASSQRGPLRLQWPFWYKLLAACYPLLAFIALYHYIEWRSAPAILGLAGLIFFSGSPAPPKNQLRFAWPALFFTLLVPFLPVNTVLFLAIAAGYFFFRDSFASPVCPSEVFIVLLICPIAGYAANLFSFPVRLWLTHCAGSLIRKFGGSIVTQGNLLIYKGNEFSVDTACMGLNMLLVSLLIALLLVRIQETRTGRSARTIALLGLLPVVFLLNMVANLFRIICVTIFSILPQNPAHSIIGLLSLSAYVILPSIWITNLAFRRSPPGPAPRPVYPRQPRGRRKIILYANLLIAASLIGVATIHYLSSNAIPLQAQPFPIPQGYKKTSLEYGTVQLNNGRGLIYIKPIQDFYYSDHLPSICWQASGFQLTQINEETIAGTRMYTGTLSLPDTVDKTGERRLYTAWWYDNGIRRTVGQLAWRWDVLRGGKKYALVNVTAATRDDLEKEVSQILTTLQPACRHFPHKSFLWLKENLVPPTTATSISWKKNAPSTNFWTWSPKDGSAKCCSASKKDITDSN